MIDFAEEKNSSVDIGFYSDASAAEKLGFGSILKNKWIQGFWTEGFIKENKPSIEYLELFALCAGVLTWTEEETMKNSNICLHCDNKAVVQMINNLTSSCENCVVLIRLLVLDGLKSNRKLTAQYIDTKSNFLADSLSRNQVQRFRCLGRTWTQNLIKFQKGSGLFKKFGELNMREPGVAWLFQQEVRFISNHLNIHLMACCHNFCRYSEKISEEEKDQERIVIFYIL